MIIYETTNLINGKKYIGKDKNNNPNYLGSGYALINAIKKYGRKNFKKEILQECNSYEEMSKREIFWIDYFNAIKSREYYNMKSGGDGGPTPVHYTEEFMNKMTEINSGETNGMFNKKHTEESKKIQREKAVGRYSFDWFVERYGHDEGTQRWLDRNKKLSEDRMGEKNPFYGKSFPYEEHPMYKEVNKDELYKLVQQGNGLRKLAKHFNVSTTCIRAKIKHYWGCKIGELR